MVFSSKMCCRYKSRRLLPAKFENRATRLHKSTAILGPISKNKNHILIKDLETCTWPNKNDASMSEILFHSLKHHVTRFFANFSVFFCKPSFELMHACEQEGGDCANH